MQMRRSKTSTATWCVYDNLTLSVQILTFSPFSNVLLLQVGRSIGDTARSFQSL